MDRELGANLQKILTKEGIAIQLNKSVYNVENKGKQAIVYYKDENQAEHKLEAEYVLMAVGRKPYTEGLGLENTTIQLDEKGRIITNEKLQTTVPSIYAIGDVVAGPMLAHKAEEEGVFVAEIINGQKPHINYNRIPGVVYTWPEVASVGYTEEELKAKGIEYRKGKFPFSASARARASMEKEGFAKVLSEPKYGEVLGVHIIGPRAADLIAQAVVALEYEVTDKDMFNISYAHPTYSEVLKEAYMIASGQPAINI
jgi:dihydrolipoamide dehydrogenase